MTTYSIEKKTYILLLQFAKNRMSISSKLRPQEEVKNVSSKRNTLYIKHYFKKLKIYPFNGKKLNFQKISESLFSNGKFTPLTIKNGIFKKFQNLYFIF